MRNEFIELRADLKTALELLLGQRPISANDYMALLEKYAELLNQK